MNAATNGNQAKSAATTTALATTGETALARVPFNPQDLWPRNMAELHALSEQLAKSKMVPKHLQGSPADVFYTVMAGLELRVSPVVACREIYLVDGRPNCSSLLKVALVRESPQCAVWQEVKSTSTECTYKARRVGDPQDTFRTWTIKDAEAAGLTGKDNWRKYPGAMLRRRAQGSLADDMFPDVVRGLGSIDDDVPVSEGEVRFLERVSSAPPPPANGAPSADATGTVVDPSSGVITEEPESFETLRVAISNAANDGDFAKIISRITEATLTEKERDDLREIYKHRKAEVSKR